MIFSYNDGDKSCLKGRKKKYDIMSKTSKVIVWIIVIVIVVVAIVWFSARKSSAPSAPSGAVAPTSTSAAGGAVTGPGALQTSPTDNSNAALNQDLTSVANQMNGLASDTASIDQGLNDQPITQGQ